MIVGYAYTHRILDRLVQRQPLRAVHVLNRAFGPYAWAFWMMIFCNVVAPQFLWFKKLRDEPAGACSSSRMFANIGMWFERFEIIITSLTRDFLPSSW